MYGQRCCSRRYWAWATLQYNFEKKMQLQCWAFLVKSLKLTSDSSNRWCSCQSKKLISHDLATLEGVGDQNELSRAKRTYIYLTNIKRIFCMLGIKSYKRFLNATLNGTPGTRISPEIGPSFFILVNISTRTFLALTLELYRF